MTHATAGCADLAAALTRLGRVLVRDLDPGTRAATALLAHVADLGPCRLADLATASGLEASTVSRHVAALAAAGLLARQADAADRRACRLRLTPAGADALEAARAARTAVLARALTGWPEQDLTALTALVDRLATDVHALTHP